MIHLSSVSFAYGKKKVFSELSLSVKAGETIALMGTSGCGKSTLLHLIAGLQKLSTGNGALEVNAKKIAYAFQEPRLFPWMTVEENLRPVLPAETDKQKVYNLLNALGLSDDTAHLYPEQLSGGMASRISLARAILYDADLVLLDEPFTALDSKTKQAILPYLKDYFSKRNTTVILVTHLEDEATALCDRILYFDSLLKKNK